ncbi:MAG: response regulator [Bacteroidetes bacterium]|nr:response regulator [Bacteroidota bacterium]
MTNKKILIVDDEADIRFLLKRALTSHNYSVLEAGNLKQGLEIYNESNPDIVILDVNLPDGSGIYYARKFKNEKNIVIFISADHDKLAEGYKELGANGFIQKPFLINELIETINKIQIKTPTIN